MTLLLVALFMQTLGVADSQPVPNETTPARIVPAGTVIPVNLTSRFSTKHAKEGDGIYAQTAVPIAVNNEILIPAGSFVRGKISHVKQPGRVKGRAELTFSFQNITLPPRAPFEIYSRLACTAAPTHHK